MSKKKLFDDASDDEVTLKTENEYAKRYDAWREKEEKHKLEQKYGDKVLDLNASLSSDSEDESDEPPEVSEEMETQFLKTLSLLKTKDPRIYDPGFKCFDEMEDKPKEKISENDGKAKTLTFADSDDDEDDDDQNIFTIEKKAVIDEEADTKSNNKSEKTSKEDKLKEFLMGKAEHIEDAVEKDLEPLRAFWSDPKLNEGEAFLRDYILNKRYLEDGDGEGGEVEGKVRDDAALEADEQLVEEQARFERAYNFRFEEPDHEYLKRYPRTMNFIRPKDDRRARKRAELRARKEDEKNKKMEEIARLKALKLKEIQEKIAKIKQVTGNDELAFKDEDIEGDFDPEEHDRRMKAIFDEKYYGEADDQKPVFPDLDEELEIENWENYEEQEYNQQHTEDTENLPHCEDDDFNMDADYDPKKARENLLEELKSNMGKKRRNRKRKTKLGQLLATEKPKFVPDIDKTYAQFMEEYYKMDCEDVIGGDLPTRFKYREVVPNDYGLSVEEILLADDKELTQWVPLKKIVKHRPPNVEKSEVNTYKQKAADVRLKRKVLLSLFKDLPEEPEVVVQVEEVEKIKRKKKKKHKEKAETCERTEEGEQTSVNGIEEITNAELTPDHKKKLIDSDNSGKENQKDTEAEVPKKNKKRIESNNNAEENQGDKEVEVHKKKKKNNDAHSNNEANKEIPETIQDNRKRKSDPESNSRPDDNTNINKTISNKKKKKDTFIVESIGTVKPSVANTGTSYNKEQKHSKKHNDSESNVNHVENTEAFPKKKKNKNKTDFTQNQDKKVKKNKKDLKMKFKAKEKLKQKQVPCKPTHPFSNLSDERLKAYGLNPKKYKNFLKYKKF